jgi:hypothetical protein
MQDSRRADSGKPPRLRWCAFDVTQKRRKTVAVFDGPQAAYLNLIEARSLGCDLYSSFKE